ncbi:MAG: hypothetical protein RL077_504 [Verrucomicrobiota bacterium]
MGWPGKGGTRGAIKTGRGVCRIETVEIFWSRTDAPRPDPWRLRGAALLLVVNAAPTRHVLIHGDCAADRRARRVCELSLKGGEVAGRSDNLRERFAKEGEEDGTKNEDADTAGINQGEFIESHGLVPKHAPSREVDDLKERV